jgi:hypothetical protein
MLPVKIIDDVSFRHYRLKFIAHRGRVRANTITNEMSNDANRQSEGAPKMPPYKSVGWQCEMQTTLANLAILDG